MINSNNKCSGCSGIVKNIAGKRYTIEQLTKVHDESCPQRGRSKKTVDLADAAETVKEAVGA
jgi:hypothetical protein